MYSFQKLLGTWSWHGAVKLFSCRSRNHFTCRTSLFILERKYLFHILRKLSPASIPRCRHRQIVWASSNISWTRKRSYKLGLSGPVGSSQRKFSSHLHSRKCGHFQRIFHLRDRVTRLCDTCLAALHLTGYVLTSESRSISTANISSGASAQQALRRIVSTRLSRPYRWLDKEAVTLTEVPPPSYSPGTY
jgi:hypothetical protein